MKQEDKTPKWPICKPRCKCSSIGTTFCEMTKVLAVSYPPSCNVNAPDEPTMVFHLN